MASSSPPYILQDIPGKGKGLLATRPLSPGTLLISEPPLFTTASLTNPNKIESDLAAIVKQLPKPSQRAFLTLHNNSKGQPNPFSNIVRSNGYPLGPSSDVGGIFLETARINHSCRPNCQHAWNEKLQRMQVHVVRRIDEGEEFTLSYILGGPSEERQEHLREYFGFSCACELCSLTGPEKRDSDSRLRKAQELDSKIGDPKRVHLTPVLALRDAHSLRLIYRDEDIHDLRLPRLYYDAFQICGMHSDLARMRVFAQRARETRSICEGEGSEEVQRLRGLEEKPQLFESFGVTRKWKSKEGDFPGGLGEEEFEGWLWRL